MTRSGVVAVLGVDIGTSSSKAVLVTMTGQKLAQATRHHTVQRPSPGHVEMDPATWWREFIDLTAAVLCGRNVEVTAVGVSGMGPCTVLTDGDGSVLRPAILYGIDTRATEQVKRQTERFGAADIISRCGSALTGQAVGPKLEWVAQHEPEVFGAASRLFMPSSYLVWRLTGEYVLDHHSASQSVPLYDIAAGAWYQPWWDALASHIEQPRLAWAAEVAGTVNAEAATATGLAAGTPVITGTIDAWAEAVSVGATRAGDLMLMYGTTMFLVATLPSALSSPPLWGTVGTQPGSRCLAGGMATSGAITGWLKDLVGASDYDQLLDGAANSGPGAQGLLMLPYFAGERTPIEDPRGRGVIAGLTISHTAGDLYRAALEATAFAVRHNLEVFDAAGADTCRSTAVGGGTRGGLWTQIVSDVIGRPQQLRADSTGASLGSAYLAATSCGEPDIDEWNPPELVTYPSTVNTGLYDEMYRMYRQLYDSTASIVHKLADLQVCDDSQRNDTAKGPAK